MVPALNNRGGRGRLLVRCLALLLVLIPETAAPLTPAGSVISHRFTARFGAPTPSREQGSNQTLISVKDLADPTIVPPRSAATAAGRPIDFLHSISNRGNSTDSFQLKASLLQELIPENRAAPKLEFFAADGKTPLPKDPAGIQLIGPIAPGGSLDLVLRATPSAGSEGRVEIITVTAVSTLFPLRNGRLFDQLVVPVSGQLAAPVKAVTPAGAVLPGTVLNYSIALANGGPAPITGVLVTDPLDALLEYQAGSAALPVGLAGSVSYDAGSRTLGFAIPSVPAGFSGSLTFQARVRPDAPGHSSIFNTAGMSSDPSGTPLPSNTTLSTVLAPGIGISKTAGSAVAEAGDIVSYSVRVENMGGAALTHVTVNDKLPKGFRYLKGSSLLDGVPVPDPVGAGDRVSWDLGSFGPAAVKLLGYRCAVSGDVPVGASVNWVVASGTLPAGGSSVSPPASAAVRVRPSILGDKAIILGRLFEDRNGNGIPDSGEPGVPGVRVYLEDGSFVFSDPEGKYSFTGVSAGDHVVKIDRSTLSAGYQAVPYNTAFAGVGWSQFITVPFGGPARGDFALAAREQQDRPATVDSGTAGSPGTASTAGTAVTAVTAVTAGASGATEATGAARTPPVTGLSSEAAQETMLRVTPDRVDMPADAKTVVPFTVELLDNHGKRLSGSRTVTVFIGRGVIVDPDQDPALSGHQLRITDGLGVFRVRSTRSTGQDQIVVSGENGGRGRVDLYFSPELRDWILVGLGSLTVGAKSVSGHLEKIDKDDRFDEGIFQQERLAFFTRGKILGKYLLTAAYDSDKERRDGVFQTIDPEKYYPVYGDASDIGYEAESRGKLYLKVESGRSYLLAGDYRTDLSENEFSRYDRALNGVKLEMNGEQLSAKGFESRTEETVTRDEIPGNGSSGYYFLSRRPLFENSERVRIEVRDRYHSERVLSVSEKLRYADYSIDYNAGTILFKEPVPSLDQYLNPVTIVVNYQGQGGGEKRYVYGGRALLKSGTGSYFGGTAVVEQGALQDTTLYGLDAGLTLGERVSLRGEGALSDTPERGRGSAWKTELKARLLESVGLGAYYRKVEADFFNSSMTGNETGTEKYGGRIDYRGLSDTLLFAESFVQKEELPGRRQFGNQAGVVRKFSLLEGEGGFKRVQEETDGVEGHSDLLYAGVRGALTARLDATLRREQLLSPSTVSDYQTKTLLKLDYRITDHSRAFVTEEYQEGAPVIRHATLFGVESRLSERMRLSTGYQLSNGAAGSTSQGSVDLNTKLVDREGFSLDSRSGYQLENALSQQRGQAVLGLNSRYRAAEGLFLNSSLERVQTVQGNSGTRTAFAVAGEYLRQKDLKLTGRYEIRSGAGESASLYGAGFGYRLSGSLTLLGKATLWDRDADAGDDRLFDGYLGSSFRPLAGNPLQLLTLARYKLEEMGSVPGLGESRSLILSAEPTYRIVKDWSAQGKYAGKLYRSQGAGRSFQSYTDLILAGLSYDLAERWELSLSLKLMNQYDTGQHSLGSVASAGYRVYRNVVLNAGYNYARLDDRDLTGETFQGQGPFFGVKVKFDEEMFDFTETKVVSLPPPPQAPELKELPPAAVVPPAPPALPVLLVAASRLDEPLQLSGSAELLTLLINGERARLPSTAVTVGRERLDGSLELRRGRLAKSLYFLTTVEKPELVRSWTLNILDGEGNSVRSLKGSGAPQRRIGWGGETDGGAIKEGEIYQYQLQVTYLDGSVFSTGRELLGVNRHQALLLTLAGGAFIFDSSELTPEAKLLLKGAARVLRAHPQEKVIIEGHTDGIGTLEYNMGLSKRRCDAAADFLLRKEAIAASRLVKRWHGEARPIGDNRTTDGRRLNRRVELKGDFQEAVPVSPDDRYRGRPFLVINDRPVPLDPLGRFDTSVPADTGALKIEMGDSLGRWLATAIAVPAFRLAGPAGETRVQYGSAAGGIRVDRQGVAHCMLSGGTDPGSTLELDGKGVPLDQGGRFALELPLDAGEQVFGMVLRNGAGCSRLMNLRVHSAPQGPVPDRLQP
ncbi:MAG: cell envelope biogenesis protein OmpA [Geobacteraceae bacterium GWC2_58_44]|nr:MAG: cell envelope biogenesis protein OmpA [Geobacteraceae bacterium GWC2_58_44]